MQNHIPMLTTQEQDKDILLLEQRQELRIENFSQQEIRDLATAFAFYSGRIEGNTYSYIDTQSLLIDGITTEHPYEDAVMLKNIFNTLLPFIRQAKQKQTIPLNKETILSVHRSLTKGLLPDEQSGHIRTGTVKINGTSYIPPSGEETLSGIFDNLLANAGSYNDPVKKGIYLHLNIARLQPFSDGNKRTSRIVESICLLNGGMIPMFSIDENDIVMYRRNILTFDKTKNYLPYINFFIKNRKKFIELQNTPENDYVR